MKNRITKEEIIKKMYFFGCPHCGYPSFGYCWGRHIIIHHHKFALVCESCGWRTHWHFTEKGALREYSRKRIKQIRKDVKYGQDVIKHFQP